MPAQILTTDDLYQFKTELLEDFQKLLFQNGVKPIRKWLKSPEVKKLLGISSGTLQNLRINGTLPYTKMGGLIYYDYEDIQKWLTDNKQHNQF